MARSRNIKPAFFKNEYLARCKHQTRLMFIGLWTLADREGRLEDRPMRIKAELFPYENMDIESMLSELVEQGFIARYEVYKIQYIQILNFTKHQSPHMKEQASTIPAPDKHGASTVQAHLIPESLDLNPDSTPSGASADTPKQKKSAKKEYTPEFEELWKSRPKRQGPDSKWDAFKAYRARIRDGHTHEQIAEGVGRYRAWLKSQGKENTEFVKMLSTFLGPGEHFLEDWSIVSDGANGSGKARELTEAEYYLRGAY